MRKQSPVVEKLDDFRHQGVEFYLVGDAIRIEVDLGVADAVRLDHPLMMDWLHANKAAIKHELQRRGWTLEKLAGGAA